MPLYDDMLRRNALLLTDLGMRVIPLTPRTSMPAYEIVSWKRDEIPRRAWVGACWDIAPFNVGVVTGGPSGLLVVELRAAERAGRPHGSQVLSQIARAHGDELPTQTMTVAAPDGTQQLYFRAREPLATTRDHLGPRISTHGAASYVVGPGSVIGRGRYRLIDTSPPAPVPTWIAAQLTPDAMAGSRNPYPVRRSSAIEIPRQADRRAAGPAKRPHPMTTP